MKRITANQAAVAIYCTATLTLIAPMRAAYSSDSTTEDQVAAISVRYEQDWERIRQDGEAIKDRAPEGSETAAGVDLDCQMKRNEVKLEIPEVTMKLRNLSLDLPQVTMNEKRLVWDNPETYMGTTTCGWYPEFHGLKVKWSPIKCDLPQVRMVRKEAKLDIPEFKWDRTDFKMNIPEFRMETQKWVYDLPECKVKDVSVETGKMKADSDKLKGRASALAAKQKEEIRNVVVADLVQKRREVDVSFTQAIANIQQAIIKVKEYGIDPNRVRQENGSELNLNSQLLDVQQKKEVELAKLDQKIAELSA